MTSSQTEMFGQEIHTIPQLLYNQRLYAGKRLANLFEEKGQLYKISYDEMVYRVECIAIALLKLNIQKGDRIALIGNPSQRMLWVDLGVMSCGGVSIPLQNGNNALKLQDVARHIPIQAAVVSQADDVQSLLDEAPRLPYIICLEKGFRGDGFRTFGAGELYYMGTFSYETLMSALQQRLLAIDGQDPAVMIFSANWNGRSKPALYTHKFVLGNSMKAMQYLYRLGESLGNKELYNLATAPMHHFMGGIQDYLWPLLLGGCLDFVTANRNNMSYQVNAE